MGSSPWEPTYHAQVWEYPPQAKNIDIFVVFRNPDNSPEGAWCFTTHPKVEWEQCDIQICQGTLATMHVF